MGDARDVDALFLAARKIDALLTNLGQVGIRQGEAVGDQAGVGHALPVAHFLERSAEENVLAEGCLIKTGARVNAGNDGWGGSHENGHSE